MTETGGKDVGWGGQRTHVDTGGGHLKRQLEHAEALPEVPR